MWEVERVAISMSNNAEEAIHQRVKDGAISQADATSFLASDTVQLHAKRWRRVTRQSRPLTEMTVQEALLDVEEMSNARIWPDPCTLSMRCYLFSRWRPDKVTPFASTANGDVCVSVVNCPPAAERLEAGDPNKAPPGEGEDEEFFLVDTHDFGLHVQRDVEGRVIQTLKDKQQETLVINSTQTMGAWIHANETTVQFNLTSLMVCVPQADLMRWKQPRQTLTSIVAQQQSRYKEAIRAHLLAGGILRPRRSINGERVVEAVFQLDNGSELCADFRRPGVFDDALAQRSTWSTLEEVPSTLKALPKSAKVFKAPPAQQADAAPAATSCQCPKCLEQQEQLGSTAAMYFAANAEPVEHNAALATKGGAAAARPTPPAAAPAAVAASPKVETPQVGPVSTSKRSRKAKKAAKAKDAAAAAAKQTAELPAAAAAASSPPPPDTSDDTPSTATELSPLAAAFGTALEDSVQRAGRSARSGGLRVSSAYAASLGLDIDAGDSVRIGEERGGLHSAPPSLPPPLQESHSRESSGSAGAAPSGAVPGSAGSRARGGGGLHSHADGLSLDGPMANFSVPSALQELQQTGGSDHQRGFSGGLPGSTSSLGGSGFGGFGLGGGSFDSLNGFSGEDSSVFDSALAQK